MNKKTAVSEQNRETWWGDYSLPLEESLLWTIGPFSLQVLRREKEWLIWHRQLDFDGNDEETWALEKNACMDNVEGEIRRYVYSRTEEVLLVSPLLADRPVVVKAVKPLHVQAGQEIDMYVSTPLWFCVSVHSSGTELQEIPIVRPSDTWFGSSTMTGELCYASNTHARLDLADLPLRPHRATSPVKIKNQTDKQLLLTRFSLPTPHLSLFDAESGGLWTEAITLLNDDDSNLAKVSFADSPQQPYTSARQIAKARQEKEKNMLLHTFSTLFG